MISVPCRFDHTVIVTRDLRAAAADYRSFGFTTAPTMHHDRFGTSNNLIMLQDNFLELLGIREIDDVTRDWAAFLERREGMLFNGMFTDDVERERARLAGRGLEVELGPGAITRRVPLPDGSDGEVMYRGFFVPLPDQPRMSVFFTHQMRPQYIWVREWMEHPNRARRISSLAFVADDPAQLLEYFERVVGDGSTRLEEGRLQVTMKGGVTFDVLTPDRLEVRFPGMGVVQDEELRNHGVAVTVVVASLALLRSILEKNGVDHDPGGRVIRLGPARAHGIALEFVEEGGE